jgi:hypothetical protein
MGAWAREHRGHKIAVGQKERESDGSESDRDGRKTKGMRPAPLWLSLFIEGSTKSIRCSSLLRTTRPNGSITRSSREY